MTFRPPLGRTGCRACRTSRRPHPPAPERRLPGAGGSRRSRPDRSGVLLESHPVAPRRVVVDHVLFVVADLATSRRLYTPALASLGYVELHVRADGVHYGAEGL